MKNLSKVLLVNLIVILGFIGCKKKYSLIEDVPIDRMEVPVISVVEVTNITQSSALITCTIEGNGGGRILVSGVCWSDQNKEPTIDDNVTKDGFIEGEFTSFIGNLEIVKTYYVRPYAQNAKGIAYGTMIEFTTTSPLAVIHTGVVGEITQTSATVSVGISEYAFTVSERGVVWTSEQNNPTIEDSKTVALESTDEFKVFLSNLDPGVVYKVRAYAINPGGVAYGNTLSFTTKAPTVTDIDGNEYTILKIGEQTWMGENLRVKRYRNGEPIERVSLASDWATESPKYGVYGNIDAVAEVAGNFYNWFAATDPRNIAPEGWRVPTEADWTKLVNYLGGDAVAGGKLKSNSTTPAFWQNPNTGATNSSGFGAIGGGVAGANNLGANLYIQGIYWSRSDVNPNTGLVRILEHNHAQAIYSGANKKNGYSIRLIKDE